jgi:DNA-binding transcriptional regulator YiaG
MVIKDAIVRGARRQVRLAVLPLRRDVRRLRVALRELRAHVAALRELAARWEASPASRTWEPAVSEAEVRAARLSPRLIRKIRDRLGLSRAAVGRLVGVSPAAVLQWEQGKATPTGRNRARLVGLRRLGRRQARRLLAALPSGRPGRPARATRAGTPARRRRRR